MRCIPANVVRSLAENTVPAVVLFSLFFGIVLLAIPNKDQVFDFLDLCVASIGRINGLLIRLSPLGLFVLTAAAAVRFDWRSLNVCRPI